MVKIFVDLLEFLRSCAPLLFSLAVLTLFFVLCAKSIKKHAMVYYIVFALPFLLYLIPFTGRLLGLDVFSFSRFPVVGEIIRDYVHMGALAHPILIIIMYVGALSPKTPAVKKLLSIRKEISIILGFPILTHALVRVVNNFPSALKYFTNHAGYMENARVGSELGAGISSFSFVLGIVLLALFIPLWVTSFDWVHKRMGGLKWKKFQRWSYLLYALLFVHAMGIQLGGMLNTRAMVPRAAVETTAPTAPAQGSQGGHGAAAKSIADIEVSRKAKQYIHITSLVLIYGSYLYLRVRKAKKRTIFVLKS